MSSDKVDALNMSDLGAALTSETIHNALKETPYANFMRNLPPIIFKRVEVLRRIQGVPNFWLTAMKTNEVLIDSIDEQDEDALKYLKDIKWSRIDVPTKVDRKKVEATEGFKLEFFFNPNPYFTNSVLTKTYFMVDEDGPILEKAIGTKIEWFPGKCLTEKLLKKPMKGSKNAKPITKVETVNSFFNFFSPPEVPENEEEIEEEEAEELQSRMELDYDIGSAIRKQIIPHAVSWFTGEADLFGDSDYDDDDEEEEDGTDDEEEEDGSDDEEEEDGSDDEEHDDSDDDDDDDKEEEDVDDDDDEEDDEDYVILNSKEKGTAEAQAGVAQQAGAKPPECKQQ